MNICRNKMVDKRLFVCYNDVSLLKGAGRIQMDDGDSTDDSNPPLYCVFIKVKHNPHLRV